MNNNELATYITSNSRTKKLFLGKALDFLAEENKSRPTNKRWDSARLEREAEIMFDKVIENVHTKMVRIIKPKFLKDKGAWKKFMEANEVVQRLEESMADLQFEEE